jgi:fructokinase
MYRIGIDLGGTKIEGVVLDASGKELFRKRIPTEREHGYQHILNRLKFLHDELAATVPGQPGLHERPAGESRPGKNAGPQN